MEIFRRLYALRRSMRGIGSVGFGSGEDVINGAVVDHCLKEQASFPTDPVREINSFSQHGEDLILASLRAIGSVRQDVPQILDIGANHPINMSNSYLFYLRGIKSVLIEANPFLVDELRAVRPNDCVIGKCLVAEGDGTKTLHIPREHELASLYSGHVESFYRRRNLQPEIREVDVDTVRIADVVRDYFQNSPFFFMSLDVEGYDLEILKHVDWGLCQPEFVCCERPRKPDAALRMRSVMENGGYELLANTEVNDIYRRRFVCQAFL